jgi:hypothetical protein
MISKLFIREKLLARTCTVFTGKGRACHVSDFTLSAARMSPGGFGKNSEMPAAQPPVNNEGTIIGRKRQGGIEAARETATQTRKHGDTGMIKLTRGHLNRYGDEGMQ